MAWFIQKVTRSSLDRSSYMAVTPTLNDIRLITPILENKLKLDVYNYALSFLRRRFVYVFEELNIKSVNSFISEIEK